MRPSRSFLVVGLSASMALTACSDKPRPDAVLQVNCAEVKDGVTLSLDALEGLTNKNNLFIDVTDQHRRLILSVHDIGRLSINGRELNTNSAGEVLAKLPTAEVIAGAPLPNPALRPQYYAGDEGLTLVCDGVTAAAVDRDAS